MRVIKLHSDAGLDTLLHRGPALRNGVRLGARVLLDNGIAKGMTAREWKDKGGARQAFTIGSAAAARP